MSEVTRFLGEIRSGVPGADARLLQAVYHELHSIAVAKMSKEARRHTWGATDLVHELAQRLLSGGTLSGLNDRKHFFAAASRAMANLLVDHARRRSAVKRGGDRIREPLDLVLDHFAAQGVDLILLDDLLDRLRELDPNAVQILELYTFGGLTLADVAEQLGSELKQVEDDFAFAQAWIREELARSTHES